MLGSLCGVLFTACNKKNLTGPEYRPTVASARLILILFSVLWSWVLPLRDLQVITAILTGEQISDCVLYAIQQLANAGGGIARVINTQIIPNLLMHHLNIFMVISLRILQPYLKRLVRADLLKDNIRTCGKLPGLSGHFLFARLTDYYGSIPYSEALRPGKGFSFLIMTSKKIFIRTY